MNLLPASLAGKRPAFLAIVLLIQAIAAVFFVGDAISDLIYDPTAPHTVFESIVAVALVLGIVSGAWQLRMTLERMAEQERALETARGALGNVVAQQFERWGLTPAERDVALLALKGLDVAEIAGVRGAAQGTVRAQLSNVYGKAGVTGRAQFAAWFVEDLLDERLISAKPTTVANS